MPTKRRRKQGVKELKRGYHRFFLDSESAKNNLFLRTKTVRRLVAPQKGDYVTLQMCMRAPQQRSSVLLGATRPGSTSSTEIFLGLPNSHGKHSGR